MTPAPGASVRVARRRSAVDADLEAVYAEIPDVGCKGLCRPWCSGVVHATSRERQRVAAVGQPLPVVDAGPCPNLTDEGGCGVYDVRPLICRLWGAVENMPCPHGCTPADGPLTRQEGGALVQRVVDVAGEAIP